MLNTTAFLLSSLVLFAPPSASSLDKAFSTITPHNFINTGQTYLPAISHDSRYLINYNSHDDFPDFTLTLNYSFYHAEIYEYGISFSLESEAMLNYNASIFNSNNIEMDNETGFVNNSKKEVNLKMLNVQPGTYQFIIEIIDNKKQMKEMAHTIIIP
ncbi:hypothetical protein [Yersinia frederiksenii]|uniref:hypothetical protein n=1 Tax=Yersinia frederiksenii TaxID=29484 RepID=UPI0005E7E6D4|nr:hypothetical protein [Yersinia frederiksenii]CNF67398.1 Uncharacterised protein [Yersinia frederiksenii]